MICYLEWGQRSAFLFQMEYEIFFSGKNAADNLLHPAIFLPLSGQLFLLFALFQKRPDRRFILTGIILLSLLVLLILLAGILARNPRTVLSTMPFIGIAAFFIFRYRSFRR